MEVPLKLMVNKEKNKVVFAEAGKDFVDFLFSFLTLPLVTTVRLVGKEDSDSEPLKVGSLMSLCDSVRNLDKVYFSSDKCNDMLLQPRNSMEVYCKHMKLNIDDTNPTRYYVCCNLESCPAFPQVYVSTFENERCSCGSSLSRLISPELPTSSDGFVKSTVPFLIADDLRIVPNSMGNMFSLLKNCGIENTHAMEEVNVKVTKKQVLDLLKNCLFSKTILTNVFLEKTTSTNVFSEKKLDLDLSELERTLSDSAAKGGSQINVKLMQRKSNGEVVFAQGKEDFADFLQFSHLSFRSSCPFAQRVFFYW